MNMKTATVKFLSLAAGLCLTMGVSAQKFSTQTGKISFFSKAKMEDIEAVNNQATVILDASTGEMAVVVLIKSFEFEKQLMQEHFNENYMHSEKYPKSTFSGSITNNSAVDYTKNGTYEVMVSGKLTIHGVAKEVKEKGQVVVNGGKVTLKSKFTIALADYDIKNDKLNNIASNIDITVNADLARKDK